MTPRILIYATDAAWKNGVTVSAVLSRSRKRPTVKARHTVIRRLRQDGFSLTQIGNWLGLHHTSIMDVLKVPTVKNATEARILTALIQTTARVPIIAREAGVTGPEVAKVARLYSIDVKERW